MKTPVLITVRSSSTRLPRKCFLPFGDVTVLEHIILRSLHYKLDPIVCTTEDQEDDEIVSIATKRNVKYFRGPTKNKLLRWKLCCDHFGLLDFHSVDADDPFFDGKEVKESMDLLSSGRFDMVKPTESSSSGAATVGYSLTSNIVKRACDTLDDNSDTEMIWYYIEAISNLKCVNLPEKKELITKQRLTLDYIEDYWLLESVRRMIGNLADREEVDELFIRNPDLYKINWFRNEEWKNGQVNKCLKDKV